MATSTYGPVAVVTIAVLAVMSRSAVVLLQQMAPAVISVWMVVNRKAKVLLALLKSPAGKVAIPQAVMFK